MISRVQIFNDLLLPKQMLFGIPWLILGVVIHGVPSWENAMWLLLAFAGARTCGMSLNRLIDRSIDAKNPRTCLRVLARGGVHPFFVVAMTLFSFGIAFLAAAKLHLIPLALVLSGLIGIYSFLKRCTWGCHAVLGAIYFFLPIAGAMAVEARVDWSTIFFGLAAAFQITGGDIFYAISDIEFDRAEGLYSVPAAFGGERARQIAFVLYSLSATFFCVAAVLFSLHFLPVACAYAILLYVGRTLSLNSLQRYVGYLLIVGVLWIQLL